MLLRDLIPFSGLRPMMPERRRADPFHSMQREMNRMFGDMCRGFDMPAMKAGNGDFGTFMPSVDISETDKEILVTAELPGMDEKDVDVTFADGVLTIEGERKAETEEKDEEKRYYLRECTYGSFRRALPLGDRVEEGKIKAKFLNGKLMVTLPKTKEAKEKAKHIPITH